MRWRQTICLLGLLTNTVLGGCTILRSNGQLPQPPSATGSPAQTPGHSGAGGASSSSPPTGPDVAQASGRPTFNPAEPALSDLPDSRIMPLSIEGQMVELELQLFDQPSLPFTTYVPKRDFQSEVENSSDGTVAQFFFSPKGKKDKTAYVQIFMPTRQTSLDEMRELLIGETGLLANNRWELIDRTDIVSYPWSKEKLIYQQRTAQQNYVGSIYIGDYKGRSFYALTHYPAEYMDGFEPRSTIMLENLQFRDERS
jgi:hypothetical protein